MAVKSIEEYIQKRQKWAEEIKVLRDLLRSTELEETIKWGGPVYTLNGKNIVSIGAFKNHCALWFFQGALLEENTAALYQEGKTKAMRQIKFEKGDELEVETLRNYILEAIRNQKQGKKIQHVPAKKPEMPLELADALDDDQDLKKAFENLTPGKQREYSLYISEAKQSQTKSRRLEKLIPLIKKGAGLNDKYKMKKENNS